MSARVVPFLRDCCLFALEVSLHYPPTGLTFSFGQFDLLDHESTRAQLVKAQETLGN